MTDHAHGHEHDQAHGHRHDHAHGHVHEPLDYETWIALRRQDKDAFFREDPHSPIPPSERASFSGLAYYPVDPAWRYAPITLAPLDDGLEVELRVQTSDGAIRDGRRVGAFVFEVAGKAVRLSALRLSGAQDGAVFVPFADATSGSETYGAGRYLDVEPLPEGGYDLDFNRAYAPFCAYSPQYSCPWPPPENRLSVPIRAGERERPGPPGR